MRVNIDLRVVLIYRRHVCKYRIRGSCNCSISDSIVIYALVPPPSSHPPRHPVLSLPLSQSWSWTFVFHFFGTHKPNFELTTLNWKTRFNASHDPLPLEDMEDESTQLLFVADPPLRFEFCVHWANLSRFVRDAHPHMQYLFFNLSSLFVSFNKIGSSTLDQRTQSNATEKQKLSSLWTDPFFLRFETLAANDPRLEWQSCEIFLDDTSSVSAISSTAFVFPPVWYRILYWVRL